jgi:replication fork clamp-binding protein CrfC
LNEFFECRMQIRQLITKYIERDETIILAVIPANVDIATTEALQLARKFDKEGKRTLGTVKLSWNKALNESLEFVWFF